MRAAVPHLTRRTPISVRQRIVAVAAATTLFVDSYVHIHDAGFYDAVTGSSLSQGTLFRIEGSLAAVLGLTLLIWPRRLTFAAALLVLASAFAAVLACEHFNIGAVGPLPNMYEPTWVSPGKVTSAWAEGLGTALSTLGLGLAIRAHHRMRRRAPLEQPERQPNQAAA